MECRRLRHIDATHHIKSHFSVYNPVWRRHFLYMLCGSIIFVFFLFNLFVFMYFSVSVDQLTGKYFYGSSYPLRGLEQVEIKLWSSFCAHMFDFNFNLILDVVKFVCQCASPMSFFMIFLTSEMPSSRTIKFLYYTWRVTRIIIFSSWPYALKFIENTKKKLRKKLQKY